MRPYLVRHYYAVNEEVLTCAGWYVSDATDLEVDAGLMVDMANFFQNTFASDGGEYMGGNTQYYGCEVTTPKLGNDEGPGRFMWARNTVWGQGGNEALPDILTANVNFRATNQAGKPVVGGLRLAGLQRGAVDCNVLDSGTVDDLQDSLRTAWPLTRTFSSGDVTLSVKTKDEQDADIWLPVEQITVSGQVGYRIDRVLNRPQSGRTYYVPDPE
jgi:hypothetical protein